MVIKPLFYKAFFICNFAVLEKRKDEPVKRLIKKRPTQK